MNEANLNLSEKESAEKESEYIPTPEEVRLIFEKLISREYKEIRRCEDKKGLYLLEVVVPGDSEGEVIEYTYMRKGEYKEGSSSSTGIYKVFYEGGRYISGTSVAICVGKDWKIF